MTSETVLRLTTKFVFCSRKSSIRTRFYIRHEESLKASLKWQEIDIWLLTHKAEKIMFRRIQAYSFVASQGGSDATAVVTLAGHSGRSESASSNRLSRFPSVLIIQPHSPSELVRKISQRPPSWNHSEAKVWIIASVLHDWAWQLTTNVSGFWWRVSSLPVQNSDKG